MAAFETLLAIDTSGHTEEKNGLIYLTWSWAWYEVKKKYPDASYTIWKDEKGLPYVYDPLTGFMVYTSTTIEGITHEMWLPVMDGANKAMKAEPYQYTTGSYGKEVVKKVEAATMFDINKTIMRCLVKNLAMFGLGLNIYAGEDLPLTDDPEEPKQEDKKPEPKKPKAQKTEQQEALEDASYRAKVMGYVNRHKMTQADINKLCKHYKVESLNQLTADACKNYIAFLEENGGSIDE